MKESAYTQLKWDNCIIQIDPYKNRIFQGTFSSPLFSITVISLSSLLNNSGCGHKTDSMVLNLLLYMDNPKTYTKAGKEQQSFVTIINSFRNFF